MGDSGFVDFFAPDRVGVLYHFDFLGGYFANDTDAKSRARDWLTEYEVFWDAELKAGFSYFVFEEVAQRLDDFFEIYVVRQSSDVMMGFDDGGIPILGICYGSQLMMLLLGGTGIYGYLNFSIFSDRCYFYFSAEQMHHQL